MTARAPSHASGAPARVPRLDPLEVRRTLRREGLRARHAKSQNFLADPDVLQAILDLAEAGPGTRVLEIGPGLGILTGGLLAGGAEVTAIELDRGLAAYLRARFATQIEAGQPRPVEGRPPGPKPGRPPPPPRPPPPHP